MYLKENENVEDNVVFLTPKVFDSDNFSIVIYYKQNAQTTFTENPQIKRNTFQKQKHCYLKIHILSDNAFKGTVVNQASSYLNAGSLEITLTVPLNNKYCQDSR